MNPINATGAMRGLSTRYQFMSSERIIDIMANAGFIMTDSEIQRIRKSERKGFQKHKMIFRANGDTSCLSGAEYYNGHQGENRPTVELGGLYPRIIIINSHDGKSGITIMGGLYRAVCNNGLVVHHSDCQVFRIRHTSKTLERDILQDVAATLNTLSDTINKAKRMANTVLTQEQLTAFRIDALLAVYPEGQKTYADPNSLLNSRRAEDATNTLWNVFNRVQENIIQGGIPYITNDGKARHTMAIRGIDANLSINQTLYQVAVNTLTKLAA